MILMANAMMGAAGYQAASTPSGDQFFLSAADYTIGDGIAQLPLLNPTGITASVIDDGGKNAIRLSRTSSGRCTVEIDCGLALAGECELYLKQRGVGNADYHFMMFSNGLTGSDATGITVCNAGGTVGNYRIARITPTFSALASMNYADWGIEHRTLFRTNGNNSHDVFLWTGAGSVPASPFLSDTTAVGMADTSLVYLSAARDSECYLYELGLGVNGAPAPMEPI